MSSADQSCGCQSKTQSTINGAFKITGDEQAATAYARDMVWHSRREISACL
jgi:hypothetical protein